MSIRPATAADVPAMQAIYAHYAAHTAITFATAAPSLSALTARTADLRYPCLVAEEAGRVAGMAWAGAFREKEAYRWDVELTIYLAPGEERQGLGTALMAQLLDLLTRQGYRNAYSCVTLPNPASEALHRRFRFDELGVFPRTGYKLGRWHDVVWFCKALSDAPGLPEEPRLLPDIQ